MDGLPSRLSGRRRSEKQMIYFGITKGLRGWFAVMYDQDGPIQSGIGSYPDEKKHLAQSEAADWAASEHGPTTYRNFLDSSCGGYR